MSMSSKRNSAVTGNPDGENRAVVIPTESKGRGKRYTTAQKSEVLAYVKEVNADMGRGGAAAASRKFGISQITIGQWILKNSAPVQKTNSDNSGPKPSNTGFAAKLRRLADIHDLISEKKAELVSLEKEYARLKKAL
ncbi:MAG TPA: hypothetical protein DHV60_02465 [Verrucomicrobiales bacterium]|nr:hypothetical protein [Verrucomicrobiales bacterium]